MSNWINAAINDSPVIHAQAGEKIVEGVHKAVKFDMDGNAVLAGAGEVAAGILIGCTEPEANVGDDLAIQIKDIGYIVAGGEIKRGDLVSVGIGGAGVKSESGGFVLGYALGNAAVGEHLEIQITKSGYAS